MSETDVANIHVELLDEGTQVWRPAKARRLANDLYQLLGPVPEDEVWAFQPGDVVRCRRQTFADGTAGPVAYECVPSS
jgi:hypothetical protein